ncbi:hypothetical protein HLB44_19355 [Aquincola sp. S2]|uniref:Uncharacterized protein n=1 Tax=Pseudaquabacterium terrae TaxID=2732868 RepID=A0ABX2EKG8_9BURK|nr:hypothetical protein [Aquabacterium terrae]NRF69156.1 hypothetical protein [Aquabacterium terrae]
MLMDLVAVVLGVVAALTIIVYATWLLVTRLRGGSRAAPSFWEWLKNVLQAMLGL